MTSPIEAFKHASIALGAYCDGNLEDDIESAVANGADPTLARERLEAEAILSFCMRVSAQMSTFLESGDKARLPVFVNPTMARH